MSEKWNGVLEGDIVIVFSSTLQVCEVEFDQLIEHSLFFSWFLGRFEQ